MHNILVVTYWNYADALVQTYTLPYLKIISRILPEGSRICLVTLEKNRNIPEQTTTSFIRHIPLAYHPWGLRAVLSWVFNLIRLFSVIRKENIRTIHAWCTPAGAIGYILSLLTGRELIIDSYEPHAESMVENGNWKRNSLAFRILFLLEKLQTGRARFLIAANENMRRYAKEKYLYAGSNLRTKPACTDLEQFKPGKKDPEMMLSLGLTGKITCVYAGKFGGIYLEKEVFDFFSTAHEFWKEKFRVLLLTGHTPQEIQGFCRVTGMPDHIFHTRFVPHHKVPPYLNLADFAITPVKPVPSKRFCTPIKDGEYWAMGLPVVITSDISDDSDLIEMHNAGYVLKDLNRSEYQNAVRKIDDLLKENPETRTARIRKIAERHRDFSIAESIYREIYGKPYL